MQVGDIVVPKNPRNVLHSGASVYGFAIVCSMDPFIMVSEETDMKWSCLKAEDYTVINKATPEKLQECIDKRLS